MSRLDLSPRLGAPDAFLATLTERLRGLDETQTRAFTARLILLLANQVGDAEALEEAIAIAGRDLVAEPAA
jgi:hypothetical protein